MGDRTQSKKNMQIHIMLLRVLYIQSRNAHSSFLLLTTSIHVKLTYDAIELLQIRYRWSRLIPLSPSACKNPIKLFVFCNQNILLNAITMEKDQHFLMFLSFSLTLFFYSFLSPFFLSEVAKMLISWINIFLSMNPFCLSHEMYKFRL